MTKKNKKYRLTRLKLDEVSLVDRGANPLADIVLVKAQDMSTEDIKPEEISKMSRVLRQLTDLFKFDYDSEKFIEGDINKEESEMTEELQKQLDEALATIEALKGEKADLEALAKMTAEEKAYMDGLSHDEKAKFMGMTEDERKACMTEKADITKGMSEEAITKMVELQKALDEATAELAKKDAEVAKAAEEAIEKSFIEKAEAEYPNVAGEPAIKGAFLRKLESLDEVSKEFAVGLLKVADSIGENLSKEIGSQASTACAKDKLDAMAKALSDKEGISYASAYAKVSETPEGIALYAQYTAEKQTN